MTSCEAFSCAGLKCIHLSLTRETEDRVTGKLNVGCRAGSEASLCLLLHRWCQSPPRGPSSPHHFLCPEAGSHGPLCAEPPLANTPTYRKVQMASPARFKSLPSPSFLCREPPSTVHFSALGLQPPGEQEPALGFLPVTPGLGCLGMRSPNVPELTEFSLVTFFHFVTCF